MINPRPALFGGLLLAAFHKSAQNRKGMYMATSTPSSVRRLPIVVTLIALSLLFFWGYASAHTASGMQLVSGNYPPPASDGEDPPETVNEHPTPSTVVIVVTVGHSPSTTAAPPETVDETPTTHPAPPTTTKPVPVTVATTAPAPTAPPTTRPPAPVVPTTAEAAPAVTPPPETTTPAPVDTEASAPPDTEAPVVTRPQAPAPAVPKPRKAKPKAPTTTHAGQPTVGGKDYCAGIRQDYIYPSAAPFPVRYVTIVFDPVLYPELAHKGLYQAIRVAEAHFATTPVALSDHQLYQLAADTIRHEGMSYNYCVHDGQSLVVAIPA